MSDRASISVGIIAKDAEKTIGVCLDSIRPYVTEIVVGVDVLTTDKTEQVAHDHGADVTLPITVSDWHECAAHGRVLAQDFAGARMQVLARQDQSLDFLLWIDSDDVLEGAEQLAEKCAQVPDEAIGIWLPYDYARAKRPDGTYATTTTFGRERLLKTVWQGRRLKWRWSHRVHETVAPDADVPQAWARAESPRVVHQDGVHKAQASAPRNLLLLEIDEEEKANDPRTLFYLANTHFAMAVWPLAAQAYSRYLALNDDNTYQRWQSWGYLSNSYQMLGDWDAAEQAALQQMVEQPAHSQPYWILAKIAAVKGQWDKVAHWTYMGRLGASDPRVKADARGWLDKHMGPPPYFVFTNPMEETFHQHLPLAEAYKANRYAGLARAELEAAHATMPDEKIGDEIAWYRQMEEWAGVASGWATLVAGKDDETVLRMWEMAALPPEVRQFGRVRDLAIPALLRSRPNTQPRIVFWCGRALEEWWPGSLNTTGIGGSETAVVEIARRFAVDGWRVDVYNGAGRYEGVYDDVGYWDPERYDSKTDGLSEVFVSWRQPNALDKGLSDSDVRVLWCHDLNYGPGATKDMEWWDRILGVSAWHAGMLRRYYDLSEEAVDFVPNGVDLARFSSPVRKLPFRCVYASSPDRGLPRLLKLWARLVADEPGAELHIAYGWDNIDKAIAGGRADLAQFKADVEAQIEKTPGVVWRGRLPQDQLAQLYSESYAWTYPTDFLETSGISAMEAMAGGAVPVCSAVGALRETIGGAGAVVSGNVYGRAWQDYYLNILRGVLTNPDIRRPLEFAARYRAKMLTWDLAYNRWKFIVEGLLDGERGYPVADEAAVEEREAVLV